MIIISCFRSVIWRYYNPTLARAVRLAGLSTLPFLVKSLSASFISCVNEMFMSPFLSFLTTCNTAITSGLEKKSIRI